jgi:acyl-coenzyme A synthetase/AMP-(fatty) acid ligase
MLNKHKVFDVKVFKKYKNKNAVVGDGYGSYTYGQILELAKDYKEKFGTRNIVYFKAENTIVDVANYIALIMSNQVVILVNKEVQNKYWKTFKANLLYENGEITQLMSDHFYTNPNLVLLMPTSGSMGNSSFVRISHANIRANIKSLLRDLPIFATEKPILGLPMFYIYGLSIIHSHIAVGATITVTNNPSYSPKFWQLAKANRCTSFGGVTSSFNLMMKLGVEVPDSMRYFTHSGGFLTDSQIIKINRYCQERDIDFYRMYGSTECTSRMTILPPDLSNKRSGNVGYPVYEGSVQLNEKGHIVYKGKNVAMGYAHNYWDLQKGNEWNGVFETEDLGMMMSDGTLVISGRDSRFCKQRGIRYSLNDIEESISKRFHCDCMATNNNDTMEPDDKIIICTTVMVDSNDIMRKLRDDGILLDKFILKYKPDLPLLPNGKPNYVALIH